LARFAFFGCDDFSSFRTVFNVFLSTFWQASVFFSSFFLSSLVFLLDLFLLSTSGLAVFLQVTLVLLCAHDRHSIRIFSSIHLLFFSLPDAYRSLPTSGRPWRFLPVQVRQPLSPLLFSSSSLDAAYPSQSFFSVSFLFDAALVFRFSNSLTLIQPLSLPHHFCHLVPKIFFAPCVISPSTAEKDRSECPVYTHTHLCSILFFSLPLGLSCPNPGSFSLLTMLLFSRSCRTGLLT